MNGTTRICTAAVALLLATATSIGLVAPAHAAYDDAPTQTSWVPDSSDGTEPIVYAIAVSGGTVYIGGRFTHLTNPATGQSEPHTNLAALDAVTGQPVPGWSASAADDVLALDVSSDGSRLLVGGKFLEVNGSQERRLAALSTTDGSLVPAWRASAAGTVRDLLVVGKQVYVGGSFNQLNGVDERGLAALRVADGNRRARFGASVDDAVYGLARFRKRLFVSGEFTSVSGEPRASVARLQRFTGAVQRWAPQRICTGCNKYWDVATDGARVYVGSSGPGGKIAAFDAKTRVQRWLRKADGDVQSLALSGGLLYAGGHWNKWFGGERRHQLAAVDPATGVVDPEFSPRLFKPYPGVKALAASESALYAGGGFSGIGRDRVSPRFAIFPGTP